MDGKIMDKKFLFQDCQLVNFGSVSFTPNPRSLDSLVNLFFFSFFEKC